LKSVEDKTEKDKSDKPDTEEIRSSLTELKAEGSIEGDAEKKEDEKEKEKDNNKGYVVYEYDLFDFRKVRTIEL
jgi:hypothetical protein